MYQRVVCELLTLTQVHVSTAFCKATQQFCENLVVAAVVCVTENPKCSSSRGGTKPAESLKREAGGVRFPGAKIEHLRNCPPIFLVIANCFATATRPLCGTTDGRVVADQFLMFLPSHQAFNTLNRDLNGIFAVPPERHGRCRLAAH